MGKLVTTLVLERRDKFNRVLQRQEQLSRSWVRHFIDFSYIASGYGVNTLNVHDITGTNRTLNAGVMSNFQVMSTPGQCLAFNVNGNRIVGEKVGIVVGSGVPTVTPTDDVLTTPIPHGMLSGQFLYGGTEIFGLTFANPNGSFTIQRYFTNESGNTITVNEVAIYTVGNGSSFCVYHDAVSPGVAVPNTQILVVQIIPAISI